MINCWFLCKVTSEQVDDKGMAKRVAEQYLIDAVSFTDAEIRISEMMKQFHNTFFIADLMKNIRAAINENRFEEFKRAFVRSYHSK